MRKTIKIPRVLKINWIKELSISVTFNNGESRIIDFGSLLNKLGVDGNSPASVLFDEDEFKKVKVENHTLSWKNVGQYITFKNQEKIKVPYEIGADMLFENSKLEKNVLSWKIGQLIKESRIKSGLTQQELAIKSGTTRNYISRIENDRSDIEIATLRKIVEVGLGKQLDIIIR